MTQNFETEEEFDAKPPPPLSRTWGYWVPKARHDAEKAELVRLRAENERLRTELERIPNLVSYVTATLSSAVDGCRRHGTKWGQVHGGRAGSSIRQLDAMAERARKILEE